MEEDRGLASGHESGAEMPGGRSGDVSGYAVEVRPIQTDQAWMVHRLADHSAEGTASRGKERDQPRVGLIGVAERDPSFRMFGAFQGEEICAYCMVRREAEATDGMIYDVFVAPRHRGGGIGKHLLLAVMHRLREQGCDSVRLMVFEDNTAAMQLYRSVGFEIKRHEMHADLRVIS